MGRWALAGGVLLVAVAAAVHGAVGWPAGDGADRVRDTDGVRLTGAGVPPERALPGTLVFTTGSGCRVASIDLGAVALAEVGLETSCQLWPAPAGGLAVVARPGARGTDGRFVWLARLGDRPELLAELGAARGDVSWSPDGQRVAWCGEDRRTTVLRVAGGERARVPGCAPRFTPDGALLTVSDEAGERAVHRDGVVVLGEADLLRGLDWRPSAGLRVLGAAERRDGLLAVVVAGVVKGHREVLEERGFDPDADLSPQDVFEVFGVRGEQAAIVLSHGGSLPRLHLELWRGDRLETAAPLVGAAYPFGARRFGELVRFSPSGRELAIGFDGAGVPIMVVEADTLRTALRPTVQHGFAWSPDGAYLALSTGDEIRIAGAERSEPVYVLPVAAAGLAWR